MKIIFLWSNFLREIEEMVSKRGGGIFPRVIFQIKTKKKKYQFSKKSAKMAIHAILCPYPIFCETQNHFLLVTIRAIFFSISFDTARYSS